MDLHVRKTFDFFSFPFDLIMKNSIAREVQILTFLNGVKLLKIRKYYFSDFSVVFQSQSHILLFKELKQNSDMAAHVHKRKNKTLIKVYTVPFHSLFICRALRFKLLLFPNILKLHFLLFGIENVEVGRLARTVKFHFALTSDLFMLLEFRLVEGEVEN